MELELLSPEQRQSTLNRLPLRDRAYPVDALLGAQAKVTVRQIYDWGEGLCPHGTQSRDTSKAARRECGQCWKELAE